MATVPSVTTQTVGGLAGAAWANSVKGGVDFLVGQGANPKPVCVARATASQTIGTGAWNTISLGVEDVDTDGGHSTVTNTARYTSNTAGWYLVMGSLVFNAPVGGTSRRMLGIRKNGTGSGAQTHGRTDVHGVTADAGVSHSAMVYLSVGDYVELIAFQDSGNNVTTAVTTGVQPTMTVLWVAA